MDLLLDLILLLVAWTHVLVSPYTKVEESFNLHATHDVFFYGVAPSALKRYDHFIFPGAVPRSFVGSILLAWITRPAVTILSAIGLSKSKFHIQVVLRLVLASLNAIAISRVRSAVSQRFGRQVGVIFGILSLCQFHLPFWMGRTLPNMFALIPCFCVLIVNEALAQTLRLRSSPGASIGLLAFAAIVFRAELAVYLGAFGLYQLLRHKISLLKLLLLGVVSSIGSIVLTISIDSYFWQRWPLWPELHGIYFNVWQGKSADWGVSPFYAYWSRHLPWLLTGAFPFSILGLVVNDQARSLAIPSLVFVAVMSALGHKEWRFVVYVVPVLNIVAATAWAWLLQRTQKHVAFLVRMALPGFIAATVAITVLLTYVSRENYPGGKALHNANNISQPNVKLHICNLAAQTGASLFLHEHEQPILYSNGSINATGGLQWHYDKTEHLMDLRPYSHAIVEELSLVDGWHIEQVIEGYSGLSMRGIKYSPKLWLMSNPDLS